MRTFLMVKLGFLPAIVFWVLTGFGHGLAGAGLGALLGLALLVGNRAAGRFRPMEAAFTAFLVVGALAMLAGLLPTGAALPASFAVLGVTGLATCALGRPWTADYSAAAFPGAEGSPLFVGINQILSALWGGLFLVLAGLAAVHAPPLWSGLVTGLGALVSIFAPSALIRLLLGRRIRAAEPHVWPKPDFAAPRAPEAYDVAVVGAGLGGLTAAALLARAGLKVVVCEHHVVPGGFAHTWLRKVRHAGIPRVFRFDSGVHDVSGVRPGGSVAGILDFLGTEIEWARLPQSMWIDGTAFPVAEEWREHLARLRARFPADADGLTALFEVMKTIDDDISALGSRTHGVPMPPASVAAMLAFAREHPVATRWMERPFADLLDAHVTDPQARAALLALAGYLTDRPGELTVLQMAPLFGYWFHGGHYPKGGSGRLGAELAAVVRRHGGEVLLKSPVAEILVEGGRACGLRLASGRRIAAHAVISNADLKRTFLELLPRDALPAGLAVRMTAAEPAASALMVALGLDRPLDIAPIGSIVGTDGLHVHVVSPSAVDPSAAPAGFATLELVTLVPQAEAARWFPAPDVVDDPARRASPAYLAARTTACDRMIAAIERVIPDLRERIVLRVDATPLTFARYDWASHGSIYGVAQESRVAGTRSPIPGLWLAGAANIGPGVEAVMIAGARAAADILPDVFTRPAAPTIETAGETGGPDEIDIDLVGEPELTSLRGSG